MHVQSEGSTHPFTKFTAVGNDRRFLNRMEYTVAHNSFAYLRERGWVSLRDFCKIADVSYPTALKWCKLKMLNYIQVGGVKRVYAEEIARFLQNGTLPPDEVLHGEMKAAQNAYREERAQRILNPDDNGEDQP